MHNTGYVAVTVVIIAAVTMLTRFLPFVIFRNGRQTPEIITYLGKVLPFAIMGMLVVFCFKDTNILGKPHGLPELIAGTLVVVLHSWKKNTLLSIIAGTVCYMLLVQFVFV